MFNNPSLKECSRTQLAPVLPLSQDADLLAWLESSGRLIAREAVPEPEFPINDEEEISALMGSEDNSYEDDSEEDTFDADDI
jgi:hypothetical protein